MKGCVSLVATFLIFSGFLDTQVPGISVSFKSFGSFVYLIKRCTFKADNRALVGKFNSYWLG